MEDLIKLSQIIAWPLVTLVGLLLLGPGGYLMKFANALGASLSNFTVAIPELRKTAVGLRSDADTLVATAETVSKGFSDEFKGLEARITSLSKQLSDQLRAVREYIDEQEQTKLVEVQVAIERLVDEEPDANASESKAVFESNPREMMETIKAEWNAFTELLRSRLGKPDNFDRRQIGAMAFRLSHGKRGNPISKSDAEFIGQLHSQFKRFTRLASSKDEWLTSDVYSGFLAGVKKATEALR